MTFANIDGTEFDGLHLHECGPSDWKSFRLEKGYWYAHPDFPDRRFEAPTDMTTDLASVPFPLWGMIAPHGRQARAGLVHDHGCVEARRLGRSGHAAEAWDLRRTHDQVFRRALEETGVSRFRAFVMWTAVSVGRYMEFRRVRGIALLLVVTAWWTALVLSAPGVLPVRPWATVAVLGGVAVVAVLVAGPDRSLVLACLVMFPLALVMLAVAVAALLVQLLVYLVSWVVSWFGGPAPTIQPTRDWRAT